MGCHSSAAESMDECIVFRDNALDKTFDLFDSNRHSSAPLEEDGDSRETRKSIAARFILGIADTFGIQAPSTIKCILDVIHQTTGSFDEVIIPMIAKNKAYSTLHGPAVQYFPNRAEDKMWLMEFILWGCAREKITYSCEDSLVPFIDYPICTLRLCECSYRPIYVLLFLQQPLWLRIFLRYGARVYDDDFCFCSKPPLHHLFKVVFMFADCNRLEGNYLLTESLQLIMNELSPSRGSCRMRLLEYTKRNFDRGDTPALPSVPLLKSLARLSIRDVLRTNWNLPSGIWDLPLPHSMKEFIYL